MDNFPEKRHSHRFIPRKNEILVIILEKRRPRRFRVDREVNSPDFIVDQEVNSPDFIVDQEVYTPEKRRPRRFIVDQEVNSPV